MKKKFNARYVAITGMLSAIGFVLMYVEFSVPIMPVFIKMDLSELPALIGTFAYGPMCGVLVCLVKNLMHLFVSTTGGVGEFANFLLGAFFVGTAGLVYQQKKTKLQAFIGAVIGAVLMGIASIPINYLITYPFYYNFMSQQAILDAYKLILPSMKTILQCLVCFNFPFTAVKGLISVVITMIVYKHLSPLLKGRK
jgi:riboflavin transporter FmnP